MAGKSNKKKRIETTIDEAIYRAVKEQGWKFNELIEIGYALKSMAKGKVDAKELERYLTKAKVVIGSWNLSEEEERLLRDIALFIISLLEDSYLYTEALLKGNFTYFVNLYCYRNKKNLDNNMKEKIAKVLEDVYDKVGLLWAKFE